MKNIAFVGADEHLAQIAESRNGESDLVVRDGKLYPHAGHSTLSFRDG